MSNFEKWTETVLRFRPSARAISMVRIPFLAHAYIFAEIVPGRGTRHPSLSLGLSLRRLVMVHLQGTGPPSGASNGA